LRSNFAGASDAAEVVRRSLQRFRQALEVIRRTKPSGRLFILIDAADNAALAAARRGEPSFPRELLESLSAQAPIDGLFVIATARTERCDQAIGEAVCRPFALTPFTPTESEAFILARGPEASAAEIEVVHRRADGNPRVIANLIEPDRDLVGETQSEARIEVENLIQERIDRAVKLAHQKGARADSIIAFLCALSVLPRQCRLMR
jgi:PAS domain-containing protein